MSDTATENGHGHGHEEATYPYTPHHFHAPKQHFEAGKMGVWLFLVTEILFFAGLFCAYTIYRAKYPQIFYWAHFYLDTKLGAANTVVLILSSFTAAWAVRNAQMGQVAMLRRNIVLTICGALFFMCVKYVEYSHKAHHGLLPVGRDGSAIHFHPHEEVWETESFKHKHPEAAAAAERIVAGIKARKGDEGGATHAAVRDEVVQPEGSLKLIPVVDTAAESPAGTESQETAEVAVDDSVAEKAQHEESADVESTPQHAATTPAASEKPPLADDVWLESQIRALSHEERHPLEMAGVIRKPADGPIEFARPENAGIFFSIYFFMTGLHGIHVLVGIGLWIWMLTIVSRRKVGDTYFGPIDFTALYWHLVDLIWIYLFPMLYLIH